MDFSKIVEVLQPALGYVPNVLHDGIAKQYVVPGIVGVIQTILTINNQRAISALATNLSYEVSLVNWKLEGKLDKSYVNSSAFLGNFVGAVRASETADSERKIQYISRGLVGCIRKFEDDFINKPLCMRIIEQISTPEMDIISYIANEFQDKPARLYHLNQESISVEGMTANQIAAACKGLFQLGLLNDETIGRSDAGFLNLWSPSVLAAQVVKLCLSKVEQA